MPKYIFKCEKCNNEATKFVPVSVDMVVCANCNSKMNRQMPNLNSPTEVRELVDPYRNKRLNKDHTTIMKERKREHYLNVEIPRLVEKYSLETCLENKWLTYNDKGELVINKNWMPAEK